MFCVSRSGHVGFIIDKCNRIKMMLMFKTDWCLSICCSMHLWLAFQGIRHTQYEKGWLFTKGDLFIINFCVMCFVLSADGKRTENDMRPVNYRDLMDEMAGNSEEVSNKNNDEECRGRAVHCIGLKFWCCQNVGSNPGLAGRGACVLSKTLNHNSSFGWDVKL